MDYYASPTGLSSNTGAIGSPWDLRTALTNASQTIGDTLWLRGGNYVGKFDCTLQGGTVRSYPNEWAVIDGNATTTLSAGINDSATTFDVTSTEGMFSALEILVDSEQMQVATVVDSNTITVTRGWNGTTPVSHSSGATLYHAGGYNLRLSATNDLTVRNLEIKNSSGFRYMQTQPETVALGSGLVISGTSDNTQLLELVIHDNANGIFIGSSSSNTLVEGNIIYNNGIIDGGGIQNGMGIYAENASGYSKVYRNIIILSWNGNGQFGGDGGAYVGGEHIGNIFANSGAPAGVQTRNYLGRAEGQPLLVTDNHFFQPHTNDAGCSALFGYGEAITTLTVNDNYIIGGNPSCVLSNITTISGSGNNLFLNDNGFGDTEMFWNPATLPTGTFNNNTYHKTQGRDSFGKQGVGYFDFASWKSDTGFDASSTETAVNMPDSVFVIPSQITSGNAFVAIYATSNPATIDVDLSTVGLTNGQAFTIKNAFAYQGTVVYQGTYNSGSPTVTLNLADMEEVTAPIGGLITPATTAPDFAALVVRGGRGCRIYYAVKQRDSQ